LPFLLLFAVTLTAYLPALKGGLLWDDDGHVTKPELQSLDGLKRSGLRLARPSNTIRCSTPRSGLSTVSGAMPLPDITWSMFCCMQRRLVWWC